MLPNYLTTNVNKKNSNHEPVQKIDYKIDIMSSFAIHFINKIKSKTI